MAVVKETRNQITKYSEIYTIDAEDYEATLHMKIDETLKKITFALDEAFLQRDMPKMEVTAQRGSAYIAAFASVMAEVMIDAAAKLALWEAEVTP